MKTPQWMGLGAKRGNDTKAGKPTSLPTYRYRLSLVDRLFRAPEQRPLVPLLLGFGLALISIWLLSRPERLGGRPAGLGMASLAGLGFSGFFIALDQVSASAVFWTSSADSRGLGRPRRSRAARSPSSR